MAHLSSKQRNALPKSKFAEEAQRKYPINDRPHAANAKARAMQQYKAGHITKSMLQHIDNAANRVLGKK